MAEGDVAATRRELYRALPRVDEILGLPGVALRQREHGWSRSFVRGVANALLDDLRGRIADGELDETLLRAVLDDVEGAMLARATERLSPRLRRVINATGVVVHTNLGRSPWSAEAAERVAELSREYLNLELDLAEGARGGRDRPVERYVEQLLPGTGTAVVNNNAAAVLLVLNTLADGRDVIVSRGQLVEIGGSFRIPDVMAKANCRLREVGTTNRTRVADYDDAIGVETALLLSVHPSNYRLVGFTESVPLGDLVQLAKERGLPVAEDLGSGCLVDMSPFGVVDEPTVAQRLDTGVDLVTFSGDKLLGGPQAGLVVGRPELVARVRRNPLYRALRLDKSRTLALEATLRQYVQGNAHRLPVLAMLSADVEALRERAGRLAGLIEEGLAESQPMPEVRLVEIASQVGGGAAPDVDLPSAGVSVRGELPASELARRLRGTDPALVGRIVDDALVLDVRTLLPGQVGQVVEVLRQALEGRC